MESALKIDEPKLLHEMGMDLVNLCKKVMRNTENLSAALSESDVVRAAKNIADLNDLLPHLTDGVRDTSANLQLIKEAVSGIDQLRESSFDIAKATFPKLQVFMCEGCLVVFPIVIKFELIKDDLRATVCGEGYSTYSPQFIVHKIEEALKMPFDSGKFLKTLHTAYKTLSAITNRTSIPLEDIRQILSVTKESNNSYSREMFEADLQRWNSTDSKEISGKSARLEHVAAARDGYPIISSTGSRTILSSISFSQSTLD
jgi:hypothetical protein